MPAAGRSHSLLLSAALLGLVGCVHVTVYPPGSTPPAPAGAKPAGDKAEAEKDKKDKDPFKPWEEVLAETQPIEGFFSFHLKRDRTLYLELPPERLEQDFGLVMHLSRGLGVFNIHDGLPLSDTRLMRFERNGDKVYLVERNPRFTADVDSPMKVSLDDNIGHSRIAAFKIESVKKEGGQLLLDVTSFFVSDYADIANGIKDYYDKKPLRFDSELSFVGSVAGFPKNVELDVELTYKTSEAPVDDAASVSDYRSLPIGVRYSIFALPETPLRPRLADDRVGYFLTALKNFSADRQETSFIRYVNRWRLEKANPELALSEPVKPIVYYIDRTVPTEYRQYVKEGIEAWNKGFEQAGFKNAVVAKLAPTPDEDPSWSAEDMRYSTVRWTAAHRMGYAIGPSEVDPRTGEILNADILISSTFVRSWLFDYQEWAGPEGYRSAFDVVEQAGRRLPAELAGRVCMAAAGREHELAVQYAYLVAMGDIQGGAPMPPEFLGEGLRELVMHEVGHTLGLRHNFRGSGSVAPERLHDKAYTEAHGVSHSVMDYTPVNVALDRSRQGNWWNVGLGDYDLWAIRYGYAPVHEQPAEAQAATLGPLATTTEGERSGLAKLASLSSQPELAYGTDEDNWLGNFAVDPLTNAWDLGSDPLAYLKTRVAIIQQVEPRLEERLIAPGEGYQRLRQALTSFLFDRYLVVNAATRMVGGIHVARDHKDTAGARAPFTPLSAAEQRAAVQTIAEALFAPGALRFDAELVNKLAPNRWSHWGVGWGEVPVDYPVHEQVLGVQRSVLRSLLDPARLRRVLDNELRASAGSYRLAELFGSLSDSIWAELPGPVDSMRRNLQRVHIDELTRLLLQGDALSIPEDARALARFELARLDRRLETAIDAPGTADVTTLAHLAESKARLARALDASLALTLPLAP